MGLFTWGPQNKANPKQSLQQILASTTKSNGVWDAEKRNPVMFAQTSFSPLLRCSSAVFFMSLWQAKPYTSFVRGSWVWMGPPVPSQREQGEAGLKGWPPSMTELMKKSHQPISSPRGPSLVALQRWSMCTFRRCCWGAASNGLIWEVHREAEKAVASLLLRLHSFPSQTLITQKRKRERVSAFKWKWLECT